MGARGSARAERGRGVHLEAAGRFELAPIVAQPGADRLVLFTDQDLLASSRSLELDRIRLRDVVFDHFDHHAAPLDLEDVWADLPRWEPEGSGKQTRGRRRVSHARGAGTTMAAAPSLPGKRSALSAERAEGGRPLNWGTLK